VGFLAVDIFILASLGAAFIVNLHAMHVCFLELLHVRYHHAHRRSLRLSFPQGMGAALALGH
jgi:hypothetical protein